MSVLGIDIGGANLKAVYIASEQGDAEPRSINVSFPMWQRWETLSQSLGEISKTLSVPADARVAVTMTGELADCFTSRKTGVEFIAEAVLLAFRKHEVAFYKTDGRWCGGESFLENWELLAASNWHATAQVAAGLLPNQSGLMIDVGSTTSDIIPIIDGEVKAVGKTDYQRLRNGELIYAGAERTPICSLLQTVQLGDDQIPIAREFFATIDDALIWRNLVAEDSSALTTADQRSRSIHDAGRRLAKMVCSDFPEIGRPAIDNIATSTIKAYQRLLVEAVDRSIELHRNRLHTALVVGTGSVLADMVFDQYYPELQRINFSDLVGANCNASGPAYAVAILMQQHRNGNSIALG